MQEKNARMCRGTRVKEVRLSLAYFDFPSFALLLSFAFLSFLSSFACSSPFCPFTECLRPNAPQNPPLPSRRLLFLLLLPLPRLTLLLSLLPFVLLRLLVLPQSHKPPSLQVRKQKCGWAGALSRFQTLPFLHFSLFPFARLAFSFSASF